MSEILKPVEKLPEGVPYTPGPDEWIITENHTFADIARWIIAQGGVVDILYCLQNGETDT